MRTCGRRNGRLDPRSALESLKGEGISSLLVEGGAEVFSSFIAQGLWDAMHVLVSPLVFGSRGVGLSPLAIDRKTLGAVVVGTSIIDGDVLISYLSTETRAALLENLL